MLSNVVLLGLFAGGALAGFQKGSKVGGLSSLQPRELDYVTVVTAGTCANVPGRFSCGAPANNLQVCVTPELGESCCEEDYRCPADTYCLDSGFCCDIYESPVSCATKIIEAGFYVLVDETSTAPSSTRASIATRSASASRWIIAGAAASSIQSTGSGSIRHESITSARSSSTGSVRPTTASSIRPSGTGVMHVGNTTRPGVVKFTGGANSQNVIGGSGAFVLGFLGIMGYVL